MSLAPSSAPIRSSTFDRATSRIGIATSITTAATGRFASAWGGRGILPSSIVGCAQARALRPSSFLHTVGLVVGGGR
eukprot:CAMPEP_0167789778 /NCGR_PEP_ID=MMETSP0111_2-20121227/10891_1 /TAXON_ID=91324 /ORGANISM="Lotharella globosa, Strain CCCM811" /LENGTH=76 /DNA_ID=CAMNT_0007682017 /DNA_START=989 /DNA_END=1219 /DNA_ORIENTATION=+